MAVLVTLLAMLLVEVLVAVWVADWIGFGWMALLLVGLSVLGLVLLPKVGMSSLRRVQQVMADGEKPGPELVNGGLLLVAAVLLIIPGFVSGAIGLLLLVPPVRHAVGRRWSRRMGGRVRVIRSTYGGTVIDTSSADGTRPPPPPPTELDQP